MFTVKEAKKFKEIDLDLLQELNRKPISFKCGMNA